MVSKGSMEGLGIGLLIGAVTGAIVGILYAPHSGKVTRGLIDEKVREAEHRAKEIIKEAEGKAENILKEAKAKIKA